MADCQAVYGKEEMYLYHWDILVENCGKAEEFNNAFLNFTTIDTSNASLPDIAYKTNSRLDSINRQKH